MAIQHTITIIIDGGFGHSQVWRTIAENISVGTNVSIPAGWNLGFIIPFEEEALSLLLSFNGGNQRYTFWQQFVYPHAKSHILGIVFYDAACPEQLRETENIVKQYDQPDVDSDMFNIPPLVAIYNTNHPNAWSVADIKLCFEISHCRAKYVTCNLHDWQSVKQLLITALEYYRDSIY